MSGLVRVAILSGDFSFKTQVESALLASGVSTFCTFSETLLTERLRSDVSISVAILRAGSVQAARLLILLFKKLFPKLKIVVLVEYGAECREVCLAGADAVVTVEDCFSQLPQLVERLTRQSVEV